MGYQYLSKYPDLISAAIEHYKLIDNIHLFDGLRVDRNISGFGLEVRVPYLDKEIVDYYRSLPACFKVPKNS